MYHFGFYILKILYYIFLGQPVKKKKIDKLDENTIDVINKDSEKNLLPIKRQKLSHMTQEMYKLYNENFKENCIKKHHKSEVNKQLCKIIVIDEKEDNPNQDSKLNNNFAVSYYF